MANLAWKVVKTGVGIAAGMAGTRISNSAWKVLTAKAKPQKNDFNAPVKEAIAFAVLSAVVGGVVTTLAERRAAKWMGMDKVFNTAAEEIREAVAEAEKRVEAEKQADAKQ